MALPTVGQIFSHDPHRQLFPAEAIAHKSFYLDPINVLERHRAQGKLLELEHRASLKHLLPLVKRKYMARAQPSA